MATTRRQPQFRRLFPLGLLVPLILTSFLAARPGVAAEPVKEKAVEVERVAPASDYKPIVGEEFFLLSETSYGSDETATVRVETQRHSHELAEYGGVDIVVYRVPDPIAFLRGQSNLHRIKTPGKAQGEGMQNMLLLSWDKIWANTRYAWRRLFSPEARQATTSVAPELKTPNGIATPTRFRHSAPYAPLPGMSLVDRFRYPVHLAKPIEPPKLAKLEGSSSEFLPSNEGNIRVPLGKRTPGLYLVEAYIGTHRAVTLVFVSDSVAVSKNSSGEMLVWTAKRKSGTPVAGSQVVWTDGVGVLKSGKTGADGVVRLAGKSPETNYIYGVDPQGGVFISENFYHDSEIYNAKIYAITDRPLYRPGDQVQVKFLGREFKNSRLSVPVAGGDIDVTIIDPTGSEIVNRQLRFDPLKGSNFDFRLPPSAQAGGWEIVFAKGDDRYGAAFRVAEYVKPHFEIDIVLDKAEFKTKEAVTGHLRLNYPDGSPVVDALIRLTARAQPLNMVEGELRYGGQFPLAIKADELKTDSKGVAPFSLPPATDPARYILSLLAQDGTAYRVRGNKEILIERGATLWQLDAPANFSRPGEAVEFRFTPQGNTNGTTATRPARWEILRLEDRQKRDGVVPASSATATLPFPEAGSYTVSLRDAQGNLLAATSHWVSGEGMKAIPGSVEIVFDKERYKAGEVAHALITFPQPVADALLTLERDKVEAHALLSGKADWLSVSKIAPAQWRADIKVRDEHSPNVTFSVLYLQNGDYVFQNKGLRVATPTVAVAIRPTKERYAPGETVELEIETRLAGQPIPAQVTLGVVDEMIYVLQPEIAPSIGEFFYHPRRNNVRTAVSLSFIGYDLARPPGKGTAPTRQAPPERGVKVLERPRRDDTDTAGWWPNLSTGADGKVTVRFKMPDALTRWRMTARAMTAQGVVGQVSRHIESHKSFYVKWTGPTRFRHGDQPTPTLVLFNQSGSEASVELAASGGGLDVRKRLKLPPGANSVPLVLDKPVEGQVDIALKQNGKEVDRLEQKLTVLPLAWLSERAETLELREAETLLKLPVDARDVRLSLAAGTASQFARITDDLIEYPWGCVEQTASRLLPLALAYRHLPADAPRVRELYQTLVNQRLRLVQMAGPQAIFGWWGFGTTDSGWLTAYAYYADWHASKALGLKLPDNHWAQAQVAYAGAATPEGGSRGKTKVAERPAEPLPLRALSVWFMQEMNLPVKTLTEGLVQEADKLASGKAAPAGSASLWLRDGDNPTGRNQTLVLIAQLAQQQQVSVPAELAKRVAEARAALIAQPDPLGQALLAMDPKADKVSTSEAARWLAQLGPSAATFDRALALAWWNKALGDTGLDPETLPALQGDWKSIGGGLGSPTWRWTGNGLPSAIQLATKPTATLSAFVRYRSATAEKNRLPVRIERQLYRLVAIAKPAAKDDKEDEPGIPKRQLAPLSGEASEFKLELVTKGEVHSNALYLEEVRLSSASGAPPRFGLLEVPLPPGADVERGTWGIRLQGLDGAILPMERARNQSGDLAYAIPVDRLQAPLVIRHLLRFGSRGRFVLPPARFHRMYQPEDKAFEAVSERWITVK